MFKMYLKSFNNKSGKVIECNMQCAYNGEMVKIGVELGFTRSIGGVRDVPSV